jgi:hypothetical protein
VAPGTVRRTLKSLRVHSVTVCLKGPMLCISAYKSYLWVPPTARHSADSLWFMHRNTMAKETTSTKRTTRTDQSDIFFDLSPHFLIVKRSFVAYGWFAKVSCLRTWFRSYCRPRVVLPLFKIKIIELSPRFRYGPLQFGSIPHKSLLIL